MIESLDFGIEKKGDNIIVTLITENKKVCSENTFGITDMAVDLKSYRLPNNLYDTLPGLYAILRVLVEAEKLGMISAVIFTMLNRNYFDWWLEDDELNNAILDNAVAGMLVRALIDGEY